jgi:chaperonin cofactor prefoldin
MPEELTEDQKLANQLVVLVKAKQKAEQELRKTQKQIEELKGK